MPAPPRGLGLRPPPAPAFSCGTAAPPPASGCMYREADQARSSLRSRESAESGLPHPPWTGFQMTNRTSSGRLSKPLLEHVHLALPTRPPLSSSALQPPTPRPPCPVSELAGLYHREAGLLAPVPAAMQLPAKQPAKQLAVAPLAEWPQGPGQVTRTARAVAELAYWARWETPVAWAFRCPHGAVPADPRPRSYRAASTTLASSLPWL